MVRNTTGGSKTKSIARKSAAPAVAVDYKPKNELERVAKVTKMYGNGMCQIVTQDHPQLDLMCHIRGKFRGKSKKHNLIAIHSLVVIGLRDWENPYKNCDLISVSSSFADPLSSSSRFDTGSTNDSFVFSSSDDFYDSPTTVLTQKNSSIDSNHNDIDFDFDIDIDDI
jgi:hypothetical protein